MLHVDRGDHVDARVEQFFDVLPALLVPAPGALVCASSSTSTTAGARRSTASTSNSGNSAPRYATSFGGIRSMPASRSAVLARPWVSTIAATTSRPRSRRRWPRRAWRRSCRLPAPRRGRCAVARVSRCHHRARRPVTRTTCGRARSCRIPSIRMVSAQPMNPTMTAIVTADISIPFPRTINYRLRGSGSAWPTLSFLPLDFGPNRHLYDLLTPALAPLTASLRLIVRPARGCHRLVSDTGVSGGNSRTGYPDLTGKGFNRWESRCTTRASPLRARSGELVGTCDRCWVRWPPSAWRSAA